jgi:energy-coupling factor transporter ATP-binding protein EcfA2
MQRVAVARAVINGPRVILADEPTGNLDLISAGLVLDVLCAKARHNRTLVVVTHNLDVVQRAKRVIRMRFGSACGSRRGRGPVAEHVQRIASGWGIGAGHDHGMYFTSFNLSYGAGRPVHSINQVVLHCDVRAIISELNDGVARFGITIHSTIF